MNLSRYNFQHLIMQEHEDPSDANRKFLSAFILFIENTKVEDLFCIQNSDFGYEKMLELKWNFQQVIKILFEGQTRNAEAFHTLRTIFKPVYSKLGLSSLLKKLNDLQRINDSENNTLNRGWPQ